MRQAWNKRKINASGELWCKGCRDYHPADAFSPQANFRAQECRESRNRRLFASRARTLRCKRCGQEFSCRNRRREFCSRTCKSFCNLTNRLPRQRKCKCGRIFRQTKPRVRMCEECWREYERQRWRKRRQQDDRSKRSYTLYDFICEFCAKVFKTRNKSARFCSLVCSQKGRRGKNHHAYRGILPRRGSTWKDSAALTRKQDDNICQACGARGSRPSPVDHIFPLRLMEQWGLTGHPQWNNVTLCVSCHGKKTHVEEAILKGDVIGFIAGLRAIQYPMDRVQQAFSQAGLRFESS